jgi:uncharacterized protein (DUF433 family)
MQIPPPRYAPVGMTKVRWNGEYNLAMSMRVKDTAVDWSGCSLVEVNPLKVSGVPILKGTRVQADAIVENFAGGSPVEEIAENFGIPQSTIEELLAFAALKREQFQH